MKVNLFVVMVGASLVALTVGCTESTTKDDVAAARQGVSDQQQEVRDAQIDANEKVAEEQQDLSAARREAMKPVIDEDEAADLRDEQADVAAARREGNQAIQEEQQDVIDAQKELKQTEREYAATQARDAFVKKGEQQLEAADKQIVALKRRADNQEGAAKDAAQRQIGELQKLRDRANEELNKIKVEELTKWQTHQQSTQLALNELEMALRKAQ